MSLTAIGVIAQDLPKALKFYRLLGLEFQALGGEDHWEAVCPNGLRLMLDSAELARQLNPQWQPSNGAGVVLCFEQPNPRALDKCHQMLSQAGFVTVKEPWDAFWGQRYASVQDADGNQVDLFAPLT